jgi:two-component system sensor histidine kinase KdpD
MRISDPVRPSPERLLKQVQAEENKRWGARLKIFLGYAPGVGKSYRMLDEARRRHERGEDVVVGAVQGQQSEDVKALLQKLESIPSQSEEHAALDLDAVLRRAPQVCVIDPLGAENPATSRNPHRWQDVQELLRNGISVLTSVNLLHVEEYREKVQAITGKYTTETIPKSLRELALLLTAEVVDAQLETYVHAHGIQPVFGTHERFLVCITPDSNAKAMIQSGIRNKERFQGELYVVYIHRHGLSCEESARIETYLQAARNAGATTEILQSDDPVSAIGEFATQKRITQIFIGHGLHDSWRDRLFGDPILRLIRASDGIDVRVFPQ